MPYARMARVGATPAAPAAGPAPRRSVGRRRARRPPSPSKAAPRPARSARRAARGQRRYLPLQEDIASTAFWYQAEPRVPFPPAPGLDEMEVV